MSRTASHSHSQSYGTAAPGGDSWAQWSSHKGTKVKSSAEATQNQEEETSSQDMVGAGDFSRISACEGSGAEETSLIF